MPHKSFPSNYTFQQIKITVCHRKVSKNFSNKTSQIRNHQVLMKTSFIAYLNLVNPNDRFEFKYLKIIVQWHNNFDIPDTDLCIKSESSWFREGNKIKKTGNFQKFIVEWNIVLKPYTGSHGPPGPGSDRNESVRDFQNFVGPGPIRYLEIFRGPNPVIQLYLYQNR